MFYPPGSESFKFVFSFKKPFEVGEVSLCLVLFLSLVCSTLPFQWIEHPSQQTAMVVHIFHEGTLICRLEGSHFQILPHCKWRGLGRGLESHILTLVLRTHLWASNSMSTEMRTSIHTWLSLVCNTVPWVVWNEVVWAKSSPAAAVPVRNRDALLVVWTQVLFPTNLSLACQAPVLRCSFCELRSSSASKNASPGHAPGLPWCDHLPSHRGHVRGTAQPGMLTAVSGMGKLEGGGVLDPGDSPCRFMLDHPVRWV